MDILVINGPNLNLLGKREPLIYGNTSFEEYFESLKADFVGHSLSYFQSNHEGEIIDKIHEVGFTAGHRSLVFRDEGHIQSPRTNQYLPTQ